MKLFDTHAHLLDEAFDADREALIASLPGKGVVHVMECCCDEAGIDRVANLVARVPFLYGSAGVHPHSADEWTSETADHIRAALQRERMLAVGEIGLDYHYDFSPRNVQKDVLDAQLSLAKEQSRPVILHDREAHGDMMDLLRAHKDGLKGIMHCFSGSYETAKEYGLDGSDLNSFLQDRQIIVKKQGCYQLTKKYQDRGLEAFRYSLGTDRDGHLRLKAKLVWTEKGRQFITDILKG